MILSKSKISRDVHRCGFSVIRRTPVFQPTPWNPGLSLHSPVSLPCHPFLPCFPWCFRHFRSQALLQASTAPTAIWRKDWLISRSLNFWMLKLYIPSVSFPTKELLCKGSKKRKVPLVCNFFFLVDFGKSIYSIQVSKCLCFQQISRIVALVNFKW